MRMRRVPTHLQVKVIKWFDYLWLTQKCSDEEKAVSCLPDKLKAEIAINVHLDTLKRYLLYRIIYTHKTCKNREIESLGMTSNNIPIQFYFLVVVETPKVVNISKKNRSTTR